MPVFLISCLMFENMGLINKFNQETGHFQLFKLSVSTGSRGIFF